MTDDASSHLRPRGPEPSREDILIGRVVDGEAFQSDWDALHALAAADGGVWERLGRAQHAHARLEREVSDVIAVAELIDAPVHDLPSSLPLGLRLRHYGGWAAAAVLTMALVGQGWLGLGPGGNAGPIINQSAGFPVPGAGRSVDPDAALDQYVRSGLAAGRVVGEMPTMFISDRPLENGQGHEVFYVRPILERATVTDLQFMRVQDDEHGTPRIIPVRPVPAVGGQGSVSPQPRRPI